MDNLTTKTHFFLTITISISLGFFVAFIFNSSNSIEDSPQLKQVNFQLQSLEQKLTNIDDSLNQLIEQKKTDNLIVKLDSPDEENITSVNLKNILKEIIHEELDQTTQNDIASSEDTTRVWELISQAQAQPTEITVDFFQSKEINTLPARQKEMVISEIVGMINRGEIDVDQFFSVK